MSSLPFFLVVIAVFSDVMGLGLVGVGSPPQRDGDDRSSAVGCQLFRKLWSERPRAMHTVRRRVTGSTGFFRHAKAPAESTSCSRSGVQRPEYTMQGRRASRPRRSGIAWIPV